MAEKIVVFVPNDLVTIADSHRGFACVDYGEPDDIRRNKFALYSTGKLERAIAEGYTVFVVSMTVSLACRDDYWVRQVQKENIFLRDPGNLRDPENPKRELLEPWMRLFLRLNISWPKEHKTRHGKQVQKTWQDMRAELPKHGIEIGSAFAAPTYASVHGSDGESNADDGKDENTMDTLDSDDILYDELDFPTDM